MHCLHILLFEGQLAEDIKIPQEISFKDNITWDNIGHLVMVVWLFLLISFWRKGNLQYQLGILKSIIEKSPMNRQSSSNKQTCRPMLLQIAKWRTPTEHPWKQNLYPEKLMVCSNVFSFRLVRFPVAFIFLGGYTYIYIYIFKCIESSFFGHRAVILPPKYLKLSLFNQQVDHQCTCRITTGGRSVVCFTKRNAPMIQMGLPLNLNGASKSI